MGIDDRFGPDVKAGRDYIQIQPASKMLSAGDSGKYFCTKGAIRGITLQLPPAEPGLKFGFIVGENFSLTVKANSQDTIWGFSTGSMQSSVAGNCLWVTAIDSVNWIVTNCLGTWA